MNPVSSKWRQRMVAVVGAAALAGAILPVQSAAAPDASCPTAMPVAEIQKGQLATGYTVREGRTVEEFTAKVLGVLSNEPAPGRHMIIIEASGPPIDEAGGIWYGMSGSPVYYQDELMGAVAFKLSWGESTIAGLTAAEDMMKVLDYPVEEDPEGGPPFYSPDESETVRLPTSLQNRIARSSDSDRSSATMERLSVPLHVSGVGARGMDQIEEDLEREGLPLIPYAGSASSASTAVEPGATLKPGESFAAALSYGDVTFAGVGTTTFVCNGFTVAFGHPFFWTGGTLMGANAADAITIVEDPIFGAFKLAEIAETVGLVDQDRLAGIRSRSEGLVAVPVTSTVTASDFGRTEEGRTDVVVPQLLPYITFVHAFSNIDSVFDEIGAGTASVTWTVEGTTESGEAWSIARENKFVSEYDISFGSLNELLDVLYALYYQDLEEIDFTGVDVDVTVHDEIESYEVVDILVLRGGEYEDVKRVRASPGDDIEIRVVLRPYDAPEDGSQDVLLDQSLRVPRNARSNGEIVVKSAGGRGGFDYYCFFYGEGCSDEDEEKTFADFLAELQDRPKNYELVSRIDMGKLAKNRIFTTHDRVITGRQQIRVVLSDSGGGGGFVAEGKPGYD